MLNSTLKHDVTDITIEDHFNYQNIDNNINNDINTYKENNINNINNNNYKIKSY